ncbi:MULTISPECIES: IS5 family transposase [Amycolatopsis]|uniref:IS5 family transposase n=1 Tax=Amycolatopsis TaxID=1813 RepID=UPI0007DED415|nr:Transposase DDE domain protein [Amycolatopsis sp. M39]
MASDAQRLPARDDGLRQFRRWARKGAWQRVHDALRDRVRARAGRDPLPTAAVIDAQTVRGADTVPPAGAGYDAGKKTRGRKRHIAVDTLGPLPAVVVTRADIQDRDGAHRLLTALRARFSAVACVWADGGYTGRLAAWAQQVLALTVEIVTRTDKTTGFVLLPRRRVVERTLGWIVKHRRCARDYETLPEHHEAMIHIAMIMTMPQRLTRNPHQ